MSLVDDAIASRRSIRRFLPTPVPASTIEAILDVAARAPSGTNMQPWRGYAVTGAAKDALIAAVQAAFDAGGPGHRQEVQYYPDEFFEPYLSRRRAVGWDLYGLLGIGRGEAAKMKAQHRRNFQFFDAPVGMIFTIDRRLATGSWLDYGMFLANVMTAARGRGLDTLRPGGPGALSSCHPSGAWVGRRGDRGLRHGAGIRRSGRRGEHAGHGPFAVAIIYAVRGIWLRPDLAAAAAAGAAGPIAIAALAICGPGEQPPWRSWVIGSLGVPVAWAFP
jgi:nitroreductase